MAISKVVYGGTTLIDLTSDTVTADKLFSGYKAHRANGAVVTGTLLSGYPDSVSFTDGLALTTQAGKPITNQQGVRIYGQYVYAKQ